MTAPNIFFEREVTTTMEAAKAKIPSAGAAPFAVAAEVQTQGRGSDGRTWVSPQGNLYFTIVIPQKDEKFLKKELLPVMPLVCGLACRKAVQQTVAGSPQEALVTTKWPNDLIYDGKKMGGSIAEVHGDHLLLGIGVNVKVSPPIGDDGRTPTSLVEVLKAAKKPMDYSPADLAKGIWKELFVILASSGGRQDVVKDFAAAMDKSLTLFRRTKTGRDTTPLTAVSLNEWGHLKVRDPSGKEEELTAEYLF